MAERKQLPERAGREEPWFERPRRNTRLTAGDPLVLAAERGHFLVRAETRRTRRGRRTATAVCVLVPLALAGLALMVYHADAQDSARWEEVKDWTRAAVFWFVCLWPMLMFMGAALSTSMAVLAERSGEIAFQIVLTPVSGDAIAAAKILPRVRPYLWGVAAALPLYFWAAGAESLTLRGHGLSPLAFTPLRVLAPFLGLGWRGLEPSAASVAGAVFMGLADAGMVWAAAHWGACYAVWLGNLTGVMLYLAWRLFYVSLTFSMWFLLCSLCMLGNMGGNELALGAVITVVQGMVLLILLWFFPWRAAARLTLEEFSRYDRLADDDFRPGYFKRFYLKRPVEGGPRR